MVRYIVFLNLKKNPERFENFKFFSLQKWAILQIWLEDLI
jgi:hypothetical protein